MLTDVRNGCKDERTFECYNKVSVCHHIHSYSMYVEDSGQEIVSIVFDHYKDTFRGFVTPDTGMVELYMQIDLDGAEDDDEMMLEFYGFATLDKLIAELNKIPHIANVLEDIDNGRMH